LILDEATSSLDAESESMIQKAMQNILGRQTTLIVTHKLSTISAADQILVMEEGRIAECGTHKELLENRGIYEKLFSIQVRV
jgi:ABC-type multidrug transport system fused ATPase/permease subunit